VGTVTRAWRAGVILAVILAAYSNSFRGPFVIDDQASVVQNADIRELTRLDRVLSPRRDSPVAGRPLVNLSFALDYAVSGLGVTAYHVTNLAWHVACAWLLFGVVRRTLALPSMPPAVAADAPNLALAVAVVWGVHPLTTEVVDYLSQRTESMMACFLLLTLYAAIRSNSRLATAARPIVRSTRRRTSRGLRLTALITLPGTMLMHAVTAPAPVICTAMQQ